MNQDRPRASSLVVLARMKQQARSDTRPELLVRRALHARGLRYLLQVRVPGQPRRTIDICFPRYKVAIFIDGCFWHGCPKHATDPDAHKEWWQQKLARNRQRDSETTNHLTNLGWTVLRFWSHERPEEVAGVVEGVILSLRSVQ